MCDYSLQNVASRPARLGDVLVSTSFTNSLTRGFATAEEPEVAVCLLPGTEVAFERPAEYAGMLPFLPSRRVKHQVARFRQVNQDYPAAHHDAIEFPDGKIVLVTALAEGQRVTVLQLPALVQLETELAQGEGERSTERPPLVGVDGA